MFTPFPNSFVDSRALKILVHTTTNFVVESFFVLWRLFSRRDARERRKKVYVLI